MLDAKKAPDVMVCNMKHLAVGLVCFNPYMMRTYNSLHQTTNQVWFTSQHKTFKTQTRKMRFISHETNRLPFGNPYGRS